MEGEDYELSLGRLKKLVLRKFKGRLLIDLREFWQVCECASVGVGVGVDVIMHNCGCDCGLDK